tara:strand:+ start:154 stop:537 length:384 start_codon:yes stop_codon:yes gene_type:complete
MDDNNEILERLASSMIEHNIEPEDLIHEIVEVRKLPLTRRAALGLGLGATALGMGAGSVLAGDVSSGSVASAEGQFATISGTDGSDIVDLSNNYCDLSNKGFFVLAQTAGSSPAGVVAGSLWWDTTV